MARGVPVVDISPLVGDLSGRDAAGVIARLDEACTETGFFVCVGHGSEGDVATMLSAARRLFALDPDVKAGLAMAERCGYVDDGAKELFDIALDRDPSAPNRWPPLDGFRPLVGRYQARVLSVAETLLAALALALGTERDFFAVRMRHPESYLRLLHYPPQPAGEVTTRAHTDYGALTLLATDGVEGLQVHPIGGPWVDVDAPAGSFVVNLGDMLARWTNDRYVSTPHQVVSRATGDRYSVPFFVNPDADTVVECIASCATAERPARYEPVTATQFLQGRIDGTIAVATP
jgi:isopenicillin N synthase-like dioxygenase